MNAGEVLLLFVSKRVGVVPYRYVFVDISSHTFLKQRKVFSTSTTCGYLDDMWMSAARRRTPICVARLPRPQESCLREQLEGMFPPIGERPLWAQAATGTG